MIYRGIFGHCEYIGKRVKQYSISDIIDEKGKKIKDHIWIDYEIVPELKNEFKYGDTIEFWGARVSNNMDMDFKLAAFRDFKKVNKREIKE